MSARRYSGDCRITVAYLDAESLYRATVAWPHEDNYRATPSGPRQRDHRRTVRIGSAPSDRRAVDCPAVFDAIARAALSFVTAGDREMGEAPVSLPCAWDGDGPWVQRRPVLGRELPREYAKKIGR